MLRRPLSLESLVIDTRIALAAVRDDRPAKAGTDLSDRGGGHGDYFDAILWSAQIPLLGWKSLQA